MTITGQLKPCCSTVHKLKTWPQFYQDISDGVKTFELRKDDRGYMVGDVLILMEFDPNKNGGSYTGRALSRLVMYKLDAASFLGIEKGYCVMGLGVLPRFLEETISKST
jgi:hypothetical protein